MEFYALRLVKVRYLPYLSFALFFSHSLVARPKLVRMTVLSVEN